MNGLREISNTDDVIDSRDVIARLEFLRPLCEDTAEEPEEEIRSEFEALTALADEGERFGDWPHGLALIRESYFRTYAEELADDIGAVSRDATWPNNHIDWEAAARELQHDYSTITFAGETYYVRD